MGELILKNNIQQDWVSLIFFINLLFISWMFFLDPVRLRELIKFYATDFYMSKFISEKKLNYLSPFNLLSIFVIISAVCLYIFSFSNFSNKLIKFSFEYYYLMISMFVFGQKISGATSWYLVGNFSLQPSEFAKITTALLVASNLSSIQFDIKKTH